MFVCVCVCECVFVCACVFMCVYVCVHVCVCLGLRMRERNIHYDSKKEKLRVQLIRDLKG